MVLLGCGEPRDRAALRRANPPTVADPSRPLPAIPIAGSGPHDHDRSTASGPAHVTPLGLLLRHQIIRVGLDEQLHEHRLHHVLPLADGCIAGAWSEDSAWAVIHPWTADASQHRE